MYLKNLSLRGFKSFASATTLRFEPGITCVVGPNGSGKSNVVDALAWVMGEQGAKSLRGGKMEDVIFAGTSSRTALGRAEVSLTIDNSDGALPIDYSEVTVRRTLFRNGGSEYAINRDTCRLLDVQELLSDSGIGREMHVIVGQGQLDTVLHAGPEERRALIEEAAGILKHRKRKEKALRKLEAMQGNLDRVTDLTAELRRRLKPLGKQAELARKAAAIQSELRDAKLRLLADDIATLSEALRREEADEAAARERRVQVEASLEAAQERESMLEQQAAAAGPALDRARETHHGLHRLKERLTSVADLATERRRGLAAHGEDTQSGRGDPDALEREAGEAREQQEECAEQLEAAREALEAAVAERSAAEGQLDREDRRVAAAARAAADRREDLATLRGKVESVRSRLAAGESEVERLTAAAEEARERAQAAHDARERADAQTPDAADPALEELQAEAERELEAAEAALTERRETERAAERERTALIARKEALEQGMGRKDGAAALLASRDRLPGLMGALEEHLHVDPGCEAAVAAALGAAADGLAVAHAGDAWAALELLKAENAGRAGLVVADGSTGDVRAEWPDPPAGCRYVVDAFAAPPQLDAALAAVVGPTLLVQGTARAAAVLRERPQATAVTLDGDVLTAALLYGGSAAGPGAIEMQAAVDDAAQQLEQASAACEKATVELAEAQEARDSSRLRLREATERRHEAERVRAEAENRLGRLRAHAQAAESEARRCEEAIAKAVGSRAADRERLAELEHRLAEREGEPTEEEPGTALRDELAEQASAARAAETEARLTVRTAEERERVLAGRSQELLQAAAEAREARRRAIDRRRSRQRRSAVAGAVTQAAGRALQHIESSLAAAQEEQRAASEAHQAREAELRTVREQVRTLSVELEKLLSTAHGSEAARAERTLRLNGLRAKAAEEMGIAVENLLAEYGPDVGVPATDDGAESGEQESAGEGPSVAYVREEQEKRAREAERKLAKLGRINPLALEEYAALEERHAFLSTQLEDLKNTRRDLQTVVREVDERVREVFNAAYADVEREFAGIFSRLFPGGEGRLVLTEPDDMLATGVEVEARPPGKKVKRLSLLSGGERSLTAIAFLAAIFKARPSPFYVLDEVEAALDDTNLQRLLIIFDELRRSSQLIVITHQKRTMEAADALYGVTMRGDGISQVISQKLDRPGN